MYFNFIIQQILLGVGLAMDAFSVSLANGLNEPKMKWNKTLGIAGTFGFYQALMPMIGWICVHTIIEYFSAFGKLVPWIAFVLLLYIGGKMIYDAVKKKEEDEKVKKLTFLLLTVQGIATSIDALSVGFTIAEYDFLTALIASGIIATVTFVICLSGLFIGKKFGTRFSDKASLLGGTILIFIGIKIFLEGVIF